MVLVKVDSMMVLTTGQTVTTGMLAMLSDATATGTNVTALLAILVETSRHGGIRSEEHTSELQSP